MHQESMRVLVVDDDSNIREIACWMLQHLRHEVVAVDGGAKAIELLQSEHFDLAVVDTEMPDVNGNDVRRFIKENLPELRVITASALPLEKTDAESMPRRHVYMRKPFVLSDMIGAIEQVLLGGGSA